MQPLDPKRFDACRERFVKITSDRLKVKGANWYCWLHPTSLAERKKLRQELEAIDTKRGGRAKIWKPTDFERLTERAKQEGVHCTTENSAKDIIKAVVARCCNSYPHGALVYSFSEAETREDITRTDWDCVFPVAEPSGSASTGLTRLISTRAVSSTTTKPADESQEANRLGWESPQDTEWRGKHPFNTDTIKSLNIIPAAELNHITNLLESDRTYEEQIPQVVVDLQRNKYRITRPFCWPQALDEKMLPHLSILLTRLYPEGIEGDISDMHPIDTLVSVTDPYADEPSGEPSELDLRRRRIPLRTQPLLDLLLGSGTQNKFNEDTLKNKDAEELRQLCLEESSIEQSAIDAALERSKPTHYVFAYQLNPWNLDKHHSAEQVQNFDMYIGEIALASYGGFIFLNVNIEDGDVHSESQPEPEPQSVPAKVQVVGVNALSSGPCPAYPAGALIRVPSDSNLSAPVVSPELWETERWNIGLESDIYAFGIVMWEVFSRREAWHWRLDDRRLGNRDIREKVSHIREKVKAHYRPKVPAGMQEECGKMIRSCLHHDAGRRPSAKMLASWLRKRRVALWAEVQRSQSNPVSERSTLAKELFPQGHREWSITDRSFEASKRWYYGRYSEHCITMTSARRRDKQWDGRSVLLTINKSHTFADWEERVADEAQERQPCDRQKKKAQRPELAEPELGFVFNRVESRKMQGEDEDHLDVTEISNCKCGATCKVENCRPTVASEFPLVQLGCKLVQINGEDATRVKDLDDALKERPLTLKFSSPIKRLVPWATQAYHPEDSGLPERIRVGLKCVSLVREHEYKRRIQADEELKQARALADELTQARAMIADLKRQLAGAGSGSIDEGESMAAA